MTLNTFGLVVFAIKIGSIYLLSSLIAILAFAYARDLTIIRDQMLTIPMSPSQPQTIVQMAQQQQYSSSSDGWGPPPDYYSVQYKTDKY